MVKVDPRVIVPLLALTACNDPAPAPKKVQDLEPVIDRPKAPERTGPFRNPRLDAPPPRQDPQLPPEEIEKAVADARKALEADDENGAIKILRTCANKVPQSAVCEAELAYIMLPRGNFKAEAEYYLDEACASDDPAGDGAFYQKLGEAASKRGRMDSAIKAYRKALDRGQDDGAAWARYAGVLQGRQDRLPEAAEALARAYERDPEHHQYLFDRAILLAQMQDAALAAKLLKDYLDKTGGKDPKRDATIKSRIAELEQAARALGNKPKPPTAVSKDEPADAGKAQPGDPAEKSAN